MPTATPVLAGDLISRIRDNTVNLRTLMASVHTEVGRVSMVLNRCPLSGFTDLYLAAGKVGICAQSERLQPVI